MCWALRGGLRRRNLVSATKTCSAGAGPLQNYFIADATTGTIHQTTTEHDNHPQPNRVSKAAMIPTSTTHLVYQRRDWLGCSNRGSCARQGSPQEFCGACPDGPWLPRSPKASTNPRNYVFHTAMATRCPWWAGNLNQSFRRMRV